MKNIFTTIEYVAEKIKEAITGHKNDEQAHPNLSEQINVLFNQINSNGKQSLLPSNYLKKFLANHWDNIDGYNSSIIGFGGHSDASVPPFELIGNNKGLHYRIAVADGSKNEWQSTQQLATTTKTDILFPFNTGYSGHWASSNKIVKNSLGQCVIYVSVKKTDGSDFTPGIVTIGTLPQGFKSKLNCGVGAYTETTSVGAGAFIYNQDVVNVNVQSNCKVVAFTLFYEVI